MAFPILINQLSFSQLALFALCFSIILFCMTAIFGFLYKFFIELTCHFSTSRQIFKAEEYESITDDSHIIPSKYFFVVVEYDINSLVYCETFYSFFCDWKRIEYCDNQSIKSTKTVILSNRILSLGFMPSFGMFLLIMLTSYADIFTLGAIHINLPESININAMISLFFIAGFSIIVASGIKSLFGETFYWS